MSSLIVLSLALAWCAVFKELQNRGHDVSRLRAFGMSGCATVVMIDPATRNRFAGADPRRECYAIAY